MTTTADPVQVEVHRAPLKKQGTLKRSASSFKEGVKKNPKKAAVSTCTIIIVIVVIIVIAAIVGGSIAAVRAFSFSGDARTASIGAAAIANPGRQSLVPTKLDEAAAARRRRMQAVTEQGALAQCPRDSQVIIESDITPTSVYDGTSIFAVIDQINCLMALGKPGADVTTNQGAYTAIVNENACAPTEQSQDGGGGGGMGGGGTGGAQIVSLKTLGINSTRPTEARPDQPFSVKLIMPFDAPTSGMSSMPADMNSETKDDGSVDAENESSRRRMLKSLKKLGMPSRRRAQEGGDPMKGGDMEEHDVCFAFTGYVFDNVTNKFTDYELAFASCVEPTSTNSFSVAGQVNVREPDASIDLSQMHQLLPNHASREVTRANWTDMQFRLVINMFGYSESQQGRSIYEKHEAVGCAKAFEEGRTQGMCFDDTTLRTAFDDAGASPSDTSSSGGCKSRTHTYTLSEPHNYRAYKLCDDEACSGSHDCRESGPVNNVNFYTCKDGTDGEAGCKYEDRAVNGYMYIWSSDYGAQLYSYPAYSGWSSEDASPPPPPPAPPPEQATPYVADFPDGTRVWKEDWNADDKQFVVRRVHGRLVRVRQDSMRLCDMPGSYTVGGNGYSYSTSARTVSFQSDVVGECSGTLRERRGIEVGDIFIIGREHLDRNLAPNKPQYAVLTNGQSGGAAYRLPLQTEYWQLITMTSEYDMSTWSYKVPDRGFANTLARGTPLTGITQDYVHGYWDSGASTWVNGYYNPIEHNMSVAATTYQITVEADTAAMFAKESAELQADADCTPCPEDEYCDRPYKCYRLQCTTLDGTGCSNDLYGNPCHHCSEYYPRWMDNYAKLRLPTEGAPGEIVAEIVAEVRAQSTYDGGGHSGKQTSRLGTYLIQCMSTASADKTSKDSQWAPQDEGTSPACGLTAGADAWLRGPSEDSYSGDLLFGRIASIDPAQAFLVTTADGALLPDWPEMTLKDAYPATLANGTAGTMDGAKFRHYRWSSFPGRVVTQPTGFSLVNFTLREAVNAGEDVHDLKCLHNCIDPDRIGSSANPPKNNSVISRYGDCVSTEWNDCHSPDNQQDQVKVALNASFQTYTWSGSSGLMWCGTGDDGYEAADCTRGVAVPQGTACSVRCYDGWDGESSCYCQDWSIKTTLFRGGSASDFLCKTVAGEAAATASIPQACLTHGDSYSQQVPNVDDLNEYYEYHTGVPARWTDSDTIWLESLPTEDEPKRALRLEPPLQLTLEVPSDHTPSLSGLSYAGKKLVVTFSEGIDIYNSPGFPLWCLNRATGANKAPISDQGGHPQCMDWSNIDYSTFNWENDHYDMYPDVNPDLSWAGVDGKNLNWGLKPAEKTIIYSRVDDGNCSSTGSIENPVTLDDPGRVPDLLEEPTRRMREALVPLKEWYRAHKDSIDHLRVHTGSFVGAAATNATNDVVSSVEVGSG